MFLPIQKLQENAGAPVRANVAVRGVEELGVT
jgi:hypothetical protein